MMPNVRRLRLIIVVFVVVIIGGGVYLWRLGGKVLDQPTKQTAIVAQSPKGRIIPVSPTPLTYKLQDIPIAASDDPTALTNYGRTVSTIMAVYGDKKIENELSLINKAAAKEDPAAAGKLVAAAARHAETAGKLKALTVPPSAAQIHLNLTNSLIRLAETSFLMAQIEKEPVMALENAQIYSDRLKNFFTAVNNLNFFLLANNVTLPKEERAVISLGL